MAKYDNGICVCLCASVQSGCNANCLTMALRTLHLQAFQRFPEAEHTRRAQEAGKGAETRRCSFRYLRRSLVQHGLGKQQQQQQQQSLVLYSPTSALQNACCGCTGAQLHASASSSARHRTSSASVQRMPLMENGIFINTDATFFQPLRCCVLRRCVAV